MFKFDHVAWVIFGLKRQERTIAATFLLFEQLSELVEELHLSDMGHGDYYRKYYVTYGS